MLGALEHSPSPAKASCAIQSYSMLCICLLHRSRSCFHCCRRCACAKCAGVGLVFPTQLGRLEANYCWVLTSQENDRLRRGFSFGFAANMGL